MKTLYVLLIILLASLSKAANENVNCGHEDVVGKASDCHSSKKSKDDSKCCYIDYKYYKDGKLEENKLCKEYTKEYVDNFVPILKSKKGAITSAGGSIDKFDVDCSSNYLYISLLSLMILLL